MGIVLTQLAPSPSPEMYFAFFKTVLETVTILIAVGVALVSVMSFLGYRSVNALRERLERDIRDLRAELRADTQRLQDQVENRISKIDALIEKFDTQSTTKLEQLEKAGGTIHGMVSSGEKLLAQIEDASRKGEAIIGDLEARFSARVDAVIAKMTAGGAIAAEDRQVLVTREAEIVKKEASERTAEDWFSLGISRMSKGEYADAARYIDIALDKGLGTERLWTAFDSLGVCYRYLGEKRKALTCNERSYEIARQNRKIRQIVASLNGRSKMHALLGEYDVALELNSEAISYLRLPESYDRPQLLYYNKAVIHKVRGAKEDAEQYTTAIEKLKEYKFGPEMLELVARDAVEFDLRSHPQLAELFEYCKSLPREEDLSVTTLSEIIRQTGRRRSR